MDTEVHMYSIGRKSVEEIIDDEMVMEIERNSFAYHERGVMPECQQSKTEPVQYVDHPGFSRVFPECHNTLTFFIAHALVVDKPDVLAKFRNNSGLEQS